MPEYNPERELAELAEWEQKAVELDRVAAELTTMQFDGRSSSGFVTAKVDGNGRLLDITVAPGALRQAHPQRIGPDTVEAVGNARAVAGQEGTTLMNRVLGRSVA